MIDSFLKPRGRRSLMFFYQEYDQEGSCKYQNELNRILLSLESDKVRKHLWTCLMDVYCRYCLLSFTLWYYIFAEKFFDNLILRY